jgi:AmpD protein
VSLLIDTQGWCLGARRVESPNYDARPATVEPTLLVIHNISLPPGEFSGLGVEQLFTNHLDAAEHPYYATIDTLRVSAHFFIRRDGELIQFVSCRQRAWHAGASFWQGRSGCNDFSIGVELEGSDELAFTEVQYDQLNALVQALRVAYPELTERAGHSDIAPGRKTDPGPCFNWNKLTAFSIN